MVLTIIILASLTGAVAALFRYSDANAVSRRKLRNAPRHTTVSFPDGSVGVVQGTLRYLAEGSTVAPLTGRSCAYYEICVDAKFDKGWIEIIRETKGRDFLLEDDHGVARVDMRNCEVLMGKDAHFETGTRQDVTPKLEALLANYSQKSTPWILERPLRFRESVLEAGDPVTVCGYGAREVDPDPRATTGGYRDNTLRLVLSAGSDFPLCISTDIMALRRAPRAAISGGPTAR